MAGVWGARVKDCPERTVAAALPGSPPPTAGREPPFSSCLLRPRITRAPPTRGSALPTPTSAGPRGRSGLRGLLGAQRAAHRPTLWRCPYPIPARARRGGQRGTERRAEGERRRSGSRPRGCGAPQSSDGPRSLSPSRGRCRRGLAAGLSPGAGGSAAAPPAPAAGCDRPGQPAAAFCRAGPARSAAARPGRAGPPRPAGVLAAVIPRLPPPPRPRSPGAPPTTLPLADSRVPIPLILAAAREPAGAWGEAQV